MQADNVGVCIKHFAAHDQTLDMFSVDAIMSQRTLREIHAMPFQYLFRDAAPWSLMTAYNRINGTHVSENRAILDGILRDDWGWRGDDGGVVMTDWFGTYSTTGSVNAGCDLEMPGPAIWRGERVAHALLARKIPPQKLDERVRNVLTLIRRCQASGIPQDKKEEAQDRAEDRALCRRVAAEGSVLLKNDAALLPLERNALKKVALIGPNVKTAVVSGGGSSALLPYYTTTPFQGITETLGPDTQVSYHVGCHAHLYLPLLDNVRVPCVGDTSTTERGLEMIFRNPDASLVATIRTTSTYMLLHDSLPAALVPGYTIEVTCTWRVEESGEYDVGLTVAGKARLFIDSALIVDNATEQERGTAFFGTGTTEKVGRIALTAGTDYALRVDYVNDLSGYDCPSSSLLASAVRIGAVKRIDDADAAIEEAAELAGEADVAILVVGTNADWETESLDRDTIDLPCLQNALVESVLKRQRNVIIVTQSGCPISMPWISSATTVLHSWFIGQEGGRALADLLFGDVNPCGKLSLTFPKRTEDNPAFLNFGAGENARVIYGEGVFVGYRHYEQAKIEPLFPFGFGLSYTTFDYSNLLVDKVMTKLGSIKGSVTVRNTGVRAGKEVVQVYIHDVHARVQRPARELKWYKKVSIPAGASTTVDFELDKYAVSFWDDAPDRDLWTAEKGTFEVCIARSAAGRDVLLRAQFELEETFHWKGL